MKQIDRENLRYKCKFCGKMFKTFIGCAKHLYKSSKTKVVFPADILMIDISKEEICKCGHHTKDHSYDPDTSDSNLECDKCDCKNFEVEEDE